MNVCSPCTAAGGVHKDVCCQIADDSTGDMLKLAQLHFSSWFSLSVAGLLISTARALLHMTQK